MELISHFVILYFLLISSSASRLPGLLSKEVCEVQLLTDLSPLCTCIKRQPFNSLESLCRNIDEAAACLQTETNGIVNRTSFVEHSFDKNNFISTMRYLCGISKELGDTSECVDNDGVMQCETEFIQDLNRTNFDQEQACSVVDKLSDCFWEKLKDVHLCPARGKILYTKLAEAYLPDMCTKFDDKTKGKQCQEFHPKITTSYSQCVESVLSKAHCIARERKSSFHHEDKYWETGFDLDRFIEFSKLTCLIEEERDRACAKKHEAEKNACATAFGSEFDKQTQKIRNGSELLMDDFCRALEDYTDCIAVAFKDCPIEVTNINYVICGSMHKSCRCPVNLGEEKMARSKNSSSLLRTHYLLTFVLFSLHYLGLG